MEIINLNGVEYIKKETIKKMEKELATMRATMTQINQLTNGLPANVSTVKKEDEPKVETQNKEVKKTQYPRKRVNISDDNIFKVPPSLQSKWDIACMDDFGRFYTVNNRKLKITIKEVFIAQKELTRKTTVKEARVLRKKLNLNEYTFGKLVYNIQQGYFTQFIQQWNRNTQPRIGQKEIVYENNPEKRKEAGIYG